MNKLDTLNRAAHLRSRFLLQMYITGSISQQSLHGLRGATLEIATPHGASMESLKDAIPDLDAPFGQASPDMMADLNASVRRGFLVDAINVTRSYYSTSGRSKEWASHPIAQYCDVLEESLTTGCGLAVVWPESMDNTDSVSFIGTHLHRGSPTPPWCDVSHALSIWRALTDMIAST